MGINVESTHTVRHGDPLPSSSVEIKKVVVVKFRQYYEGNRNRAQDMFCRIYCSHEMQKRLLSGDKEAELLAVHGLFNSGLLFVGDGLCHSVFIYDEDKNFAESYYIHNFKI